MSKVEDGKLHIVMFPWLAFGHMIPYLELSKLIAQKGHKISFISTPRNIDRLPNLPPYIKPLINFVKIPLPQVDNLPENAEATMDLPYDKVKYLKIAYDGLQQPITQFLTDSSPDWVFYDLVPYWVGSIAAKSNISSAFFSTFNAVTLGFSGPVSVLKGEDEDSRKSAVDLTVSPKWVPFESTVAFRLFEVSRIFEDLVKSGDGSVSVAFRLGSSIQNCDVVAVRGSCFESEWFQLVEEIHKKPVFPVGELPPSDVLNLNDENNVEWRSIKEWLDNQEKESVVYVAFGSEAKPSQNELTELAHGLELSKLPFFWVLRKQTGVELPEGFEERTKGRGVVCTSWVPQLKILSHESVGGFLSHAGWSSVVEGVMFGRGLILLTFLADQGLNARFLEEKNMGYSIPRDEGDGSFTREAVAESLRLVMVEKEGKIYRDKVKEMKGVFGDRDMQERYVDDLLGFLQSHKKLKS